jgi:FixJ family two-component response regulator
MSDATEPLGVVIVIDDDAPFRESLRALVETVGLRAHMFGSAAEFLRSTIPDGPSCLVLDVRLPGVSGLDFQTQLAAASITMPVVLVTGHADVPMAVRAMKQGAVEFLTKPFRDQDLLDAVQSALELDRLRRERHYSATELRTRFEALTAREREVITFVVDGLMNKQIAGRLGISEITVKVHRGNGMRKLGAKSLADLMRMAQMWHLHSPGWLSKPD